MKKRYGYIILLIFTIFFPLTALSMYNSYISKKIKMLKNIEQSKSIKISETTMVVKNSKLNFQYSYKNPVVSFYNFYKKFKIYTIKYGDTLWKIMYKFGLKFNKLKNLIIINKIKDPDLIYAEDKIKIPSD